MCHVFYPEGKPKISHLLRCQGLAVKYYGFALGRLGSGKSSAFAKTGLTIPLSQKKYPGSKSYPSGFLDLLLSTHRFSPLTLGISIEYKTDSNNFLYIP